MITVIIPYALNSLPKVVDSLKKVDYPKHKIQLLISVGNNPSKQRNQALKQAKGKIIFFFDDDPIIPKDYFKNILPYFKDKTVAGVGGPVLTKRNVSFFQKCAGYVLASYFATQKMHARFTPVGKTRIANEKDLISCNLAIRKSVLGKKPFDERLYPNEENELLNRLRREGYKLIYDPKAKTYRGQRENLYQFAKQFFRYGKSRVEHLILQPKNFTPLFLMPACFVFYLLLLILFPLPWMFIPLVLYILLDLIFSVKIVFEQKSLTSLFCVPYLFLIVHVVYGLGTIYGPLQPFKRPRQKKIQVKEEKL
ncbi:MAG: glycosyltransferase [archaeon]